MTTAHDFSMLRSLASERLADALTELGNAVVDLVAAEAGCRLASANAAPREKAGRVHQPRSCDNEARRRRRA